MLVILKPILSLHSVRAHPLKKTEETRICGSIVKTLFSSTNLVLTIMIILYLVIQ